MTRPPVFDSGSLAQHLGSLRKGDTTGLATGRVVAVDSAGAPTINVGGAELTGLQLPAVPLSVGDNVQLVRQGSRYVVVGLIAAANLPASGTVASVPSNSSTIIVTTALGSIAAGWVAAYTPTVGDAVWITWLGSTPLVLGKRGKTGTPAAPTPSPPPPSPPPPPPQIVTGTTTFTAVGSGTYRSGEWLDNGISNGNVMQGDYGFGANSGAWFTGGRPHATLSGATITRAQVWLARTQGGTYAAQTVHLSRVTNNTRPGGALTFDASHTYNGISIPVGGSGWYTIPVALAQSLVDSGGSLGVTSSDPYIRLYGVDNNGSAGALKLTWKRSS